MKLNIKLNKTKGRYYSRCCIPKVPKKKKKPFSSREQKKKIKMALLNVNPDGPVPSSPLQNLKKCYYSQ